MPQSAGHRLGRSNPVKRARLPERSAGNRAVGRLDFLSWGRKGVALPTRWTSAPCSYRVRMTIAQLRPTQRELLAHLDKGPSVQPKGDLSRHRFLDRVR